jgi:hypothetical protein
MKTYVGEEVNLRVFLTWTLDAYEWSAWRPNRFAPRGDIPRYPLNWRQSGPKARLYAVETRKNTSPYWESSTNSSVIQSLYHLSYPDFRWCIQSSLCFKLLIVISSLCNSLFIQFYESGSRYSSITKLFYNNWASWVQWLNTTELKCGIPLAEVQTPGGIGACRFIYSGQFNWVVFHLWLSLPVTLGIGSPASRQFFYFQ